MIGMKAFGGYHPLVLVTYFISVLLISMFVSNPIIQTEALVCGILFCLMLRKRSKIAGDIGFYLPLFLIAAITNPLFSHNGVTPLFFMNGNPITLEAIIYGIFLAVMLIGVLIWCKCYSEIMTSDKFLYLFGRVIPKLSLVLSMAIRFIPMFKRQLKKVSNAQKTMGLYSTDSFVNKIKSHGRVFTAMIAWSLENSIETASSMKARGYGIKGRTSFSLFRFLKKDLFMLALSVLLLAMTLVPASIGETTFYYYPRITSVRITPGAILAYTAFGILSFLPFAVELKETIVWKYCISKI